MGGLEEEMMAIEFIASHGLQSRCRLITTSKLQETKAHAESFAGSLSIALCFDSSRDESIEWLKGFVEAWLSC